MNEVEMKARIEQLEALLKFADARINVLVDELCEEAKRTAEEKLRADQMTHQHAMQAKMHAQASEQLAAAQQGVQRGVTAQAPDAFVEWFSKNYPADTSIFEPGWHARHIYRWALAHAKIATHPTQQGLELDAARYQWLREQHDKGDDSVTIFIGDEQHGPGHLDAQIDEAIAAQAKQGDQANG